MHKCMYPLGMAPHTRGYIYDRENARYVDFACVAVKIPVMGDGYTYMAT